MAAYKMRKVRIDKYGNLRPVSKRARTYFTPHRLHLGGLLYSLWRNEMWCVERVL